MCCHLLTNTALPAAHRENGAPQPAPVKRWLQLRFGFHATPILPFDYDFTAIADRDDL